MTLARITLAAPIAGPEVQVAVGPEPERAAAVVELGLLELEHDPLRRRVGAVRVARIDPILAEDVRVIEAGGGGSQRRPVVDEEPPVGREVRVEGEAEQPALVVVGISGTTFADIEEWLAAQGPVAQDRDRASLVDDERRPLPSGAATRPSGATRPSTTTSIPTSAVGWGAGVERVGLAEETAADGGPELDEDVGAAGDVDALGAHAARMDTMTAQKRTARERARR